LRGEDKGCLGRYKHDKRSAHKYEPIATYFYQHYPRRHEQRLKQYGLLCERVEMSMHRTIKISRRCHSPGLVESWRLDPPHSVHRIDERREDQDASSLMLPTYIHNIIRMPSTATVSTTYYTETESSLDGLPDELLLQILGHLDYPFLMALSRVRTLGLCCGSC
jgi:hypothetical protein